MKNCETCRKPLKKESRTQCFGCRCASYFAKNGGNTCNTRRERAFKHLNESKPGLFDRIFGL